MLINPRMPLKTNPVKALLYNFVPISLKRVNYDKYDKYVEISEKIKPDIFKYLDSFKSTIGNFAKNEKIKIKISPSNIEESVESSTQQLQIIVSNQAKNFTTKTFIADQDYEMNKKLLDEISVNDSVILKKQLLEKNSMPNFRTLFKIIGEMTTNLKKVDPWKL